MKERNLSDLSEDKISLTHKRTFAIALVIVAALITATISTVAVEASRGPKQIKSSASYGVAPNPEPNPGLTVACPSPTFNILLLVDRSYSVINGAGGEGNVISMKDQINSFLQVISERAKDYVGTANVSIGAFGSISVLQDGPAWRSDWQSKLNIADDSNFDLKTQLVNDIWFAGGSPDVVPYIGHGTYVPNLGYNPSGLSTAGNLGQTNQQSAFFEASRFIDSRTPNTNNPAAIGSNDDYDMVIVLTDGLPNRTSGPDAIAGTSDDVFSGSANPSTAVLQQTQDAVVRLRKGQVQAGVTGTNVYPRTNVFGMLVGPAPTDPDEVAERNEVMNAVFGQNVSTQFPKWSSVSGFGPSIGAELDKVMGGFTCASTKTPVNTGISISATPSTINAFEGQTGLSFNLKVTNNSSNAVRLDDVKYAVGVNTTIEPADSSFVPISCGPGLLAPKASCDMVYNFDVTGPSSFKFYAWAKGHALFDAAIYELASGDTMNPKDGPDVVTVNVSPAKYPS